MKYEVKINHLKTALLSMKYKFSQAKRLYKSTPIFRLNKEMRANIIANEAVQSAVVASNMDILLSTGNPLFFPASLSVVDSKTSSTLSWLWLPSCQE
jgi:hypothetical protein